MRAPRQTRGRWVVLAIAVLAVAALAISLAGCGSEQTFTAQSFVAKINSEGLKIELGEPLVSEESGKKTYALNLPQVLKLPGGNSSNASLAVYDSQDDATGGLTNCQAAGEFQCFQAANIVVIVEGSGLEVQQLGVAIKRISPS